MTSRNDTATRHVTTAIVLGVGLFAAADSYSHLDSLARDHHQDIVSAALLPLAADGVIAAVSAVILVASRQGKGIPLRARVTLVLGIAATVAANLAYGLAYGRTSALLSVWAPLAYIACMELLAWMRANTGMLHPKPAVKTASATDTSPGAGVDAPEPPVRLAVADPRRGSRQPASVLIEAAERAFPNLRHGVIPPLREIQSALSVGQPKAQLVQRHFRALQATG